MSLINSLLSPKVHVRLTVRSRTMEGRYQVQNSIKSWGFPGTMRVATDGYLFVELEGRKQTLEKRIEELARHPMVLDGSMVTQWKPYTGSYSYLAVSF